MARKGLKSGGTSGRLSRDKETQLKRICETDAFRLFSQGQKERILDTDFYTYLGATVRTGRHEFEGCLQAVADAVADAVRIFKYWPTKKLVLQPALCE